MVVDHAYECVSKIRGEKNTSKNRSKNVHIQLVIAIGIIMSRTFQTFYKSIALLLLQDHSKLKANFLRPSPKKFQHWGGDIHKPLCLHSR